MSLLQKLFDTDFWKQRVKALSRDLNTTYDNLCEVTEKWRSAEEDVSDLKAEVQLAEDDFDEMANLYAGLHKAFDDLVDTNADLKVFSANKLRESSSYKTTYENIKVQLHTLVDERIKRDTEYKILSEQYDKLHKVNETLTAEIAKLEQSKYPIYEKLVVDKANSDQALAKIMLEKNQLDREHRALKLNYDALQSELLIKNRRLIDKVKVVEGIVKELMPVSMRFQTALFDLIEVPNVSGT